MLTISEQTKNSPGSRAYAVAALVRELNAAIHARIGNGLAHTGLTLPQLLLVKAIAHAGPMTMGGIAKELSVSKPTAVGIVDRLERDGLVTRRRDPDGDRREVTVDFAPESAGRIREIGSAVAAALDSAFGDISPEDLEVLERALRTALKTLREQ